MKKTLTLFFLSFLLYTGYSQEEFSQRYGRITDHELAMTSYENDTSASAVFIYEDVRLYYMVTDQIRRVTEYSAKIKVLDSDGTSWADIEIPYLESTGKKEIVSNIDAVAYNLEDGKTVKTQLKRQMIFREQANENLKFVKFSIPDVRAGTVIEYRYKITSEHLTWIPDVDIQHSIPVIYTNANLVVPEWFDFKLNTRGYVRVPVTRERKAETARFSNGRELPYMSEVIIINAEHTPALKREAHVWNHNDFRGRIEFEIAGYRFPHDLYRPRSQTWAAVNESLKKSDFHRYTNLSCPFKDVVAKGKVIYDDPRDLAMYVKNHVNSVVKWNGTYRLIGENPRNALKDGTGSSAAINFLIMSGLKECGIQAVPVMLNPRSYGRLPLAWPTLDNVNAFVLLFETQEGAFFLDGTDNFSTLNVLPPNLMVDRARLYGDNDENNWLDLSSLSKNVTKHNMGAKVDPDGTVNIEHILITSNIPAMQVNKKISAAGSDEKYMEGLEESRGIVLESWEAAERTGTNVTQKMKYSLECEKSGGDLMLKAVLIDFMESNILTDQERQLPVEFDYPYSAEVSFTITIPEGYGFKEVPENISMSVCEGGASFRYMSQVVGYMLTARMTLTVDRIIYSHMEYDDLRTFFGLVSDRCSSRIVISEI